MRFQFILAEKAIHAVEILCRVLLVSRSGFYAWCRHDESARARTDRRLAVKIRASHRASGGTYGRPRVLKDLREDGERVGHKRVARIMAENQLVGRRKRRFRKTTDSRHLEPVAPNLLKRNFSAPAPNRIWAADITYVRTWEGWLYVAAVIDLYSRRVVGLTVADHLRTELPLAALQQALLVRRPQAGMIHHSDRGVQYASLEYRTELAHHGVLCSMSRKGDCWDNAVVESFFSTLKEELTTRQPLPTKRLARQAITNWVFGFYNVRRRHSALGYMSPASYEADCRRNLAA